MRQHVNSKQHGMVCIVIQVHQCIKTWSCNIMWIWFGCFWNPSDLWINWKQKVINLTIISSLMALWVVNMAIYGATSYDKVVKLTTFHFCDSWGSFQNNNCLSKHRLDIMNIRQSLYHHIKRPSYLYNGNSFVDKTVFISRLSRGGWHFLCCIIHLDMK